MYILQFVKKSVARMFNISYLSYVFQNKIDRFLFIINACNDTQYMSQYDLFANGTDFKIKLITFPTLSVRVMILSI